MMLKIQYSIQESIIIIKHLEIYYNRNNITVFAVFNVMLYCNIIIVMLF